MAAALNDQSEPYRPDILRGSFGGGGREGFARRIEQLSCVRTTILGAGRAELRPLSF